MAQRFRKIDPRIWDDEKFKTLGPEAQLVAFYLVTNPQSNRIGFYKMSRAQAAETLRMPPATFAQRFADVLNTFGWKYDDAAGVLYLDSWWKYNPPENPNVLKGNLDDLHDLPQTALLDEFMANTRYLTGKVAETFVDTLSKRYDLAGTMFAETRARAETRAVTETGSAPRLFTEPGALAATGTAAEVVLTFQVLKGKKGDEVEYDLTRGKLDEYAATFPGIDVETVARNAWQYLRDNPRKRPTQSGILNFLRQQMDRAQNYAATRAASTTSRAGGGAGDARRERLQRAVKPS